MTEQQKTSEQIMREALEEIKESWVDNYEFSFNPGLIDKALEEADKAESISEQSNRELKRYFDGEAIGRAEALQEVIERIKIKKEVLPIHSENMLKKKPSTNSKEYDEMFMNLIIGASNITLDFVLDLLESEMK